MSDAARRALSLWLGLVIAMVFVMIIVGGLTRLTDSGLSITEWKPVTGAIPPLSQQAWLDEFEKYRAIPEYQLQNRGMSMAEFQVIYWWEWAHRQLGRGIGLAYALPLFVFLALGTIPKILRPRMVVILVLGGLQGAVGWWMVASGLTERVDVSHYRLAAHLGLAFVLFGALVWTFADIRARALASVRLDGWSVAAGLFAIGVFIQILLGALVAGLDAGRIHTTWPLMDGGLVPLDYGALGPWWHDAFENRASVQFHHRMGGYALAIAAIALVVMVLRGGRSQTRGPAIAVGALTTGQVALGIVTLVYAAPIALSAAHQGMAALLFAASLVWARAAMASAPAPRPVTAPAIA